MRISDCISDVCSSDLPPAPLYVRREPPSARYTQPPSAGSATMTEQPKQTLNEAQDNAPAAAEAETVDTRPVDPTTGKNGSASGRARGGQYGYNPVGRESLHKNKAEFDVIQ